MHYSKRYLNPKRAGGAESAPPRHFLLYLSRLLFFRAKTSWLFSFKPCVRFKSIFLEIGPGVMTRCCVIERWVQRKTDQKLIFNGNYTQTVFFCIFLFQDTEKVYFRSQILERPSIGEYWNISGVPVLPENVIFTFFRKCWCYSEAYNTGTQK